jgi:hypothetical protein
MYQVRRASILLAFLVLFVCQVHESAWCGPLQGKSTGTPATVPESASFREGQAPRPAVLLSSLLLFRGKPIQVDNPLFELPKIDASDTSWRENWSFFIDKYVSSKPEEEIYAGIDGYRGDAGLRYMISTGWRASLGMYVVQNMEAFKVLPLLGLEWNRISDSRFSALVGIPETSLAYRITDGLTSRVGLRYDHGLAGLTTALFPEEQLIVPREDITAGLYLDTRTGPDCLLTWGVQYSFYDDAASGTEDEQSVGTFLKIVYAF